MGDIFFGELVERIAIAHHTFWADDRDAGYTWKDVNRADRAYAMDALAIIGQAGLKLENRSDD